MGDQYGRPVWATRKIRILSLLHFSEPHWLLFSVSQVILAQIFLAAGLYLSKYVNHQALLALSAYLSFLIANYQWLTFRVPIGNGVNLHSGGWMLDVRLECDSILTLTSPAWSLSFRYRLGLSSLSISHTKNVSISTERNIVRSRYLIDYALRGGLVVTGNKTCDAVFGVSQS